MTEKAVGAQTGNKGRLLLEGREHLEASGITDVVSLDDSGAVLKTDDGLLILDGVGLRVKRLDVDGGFICLEGRVNGIVYSDGSGSKGRKKLLR